MNTDHHSPDVETSSTVVPIGTSTNLLYGYDPSWLAEGTGNNALFSTPTSPVQPSSPSVPSASGTWSLPTVTLHDTPESLLDVLLPYQQHDPEDGLHAATLPCGPLLIGDEDREKALATLSDTLGVNLGADDTGFALVRLERVDGEATHASNQTGLQAEPVFRDGNAAVL